MLAILLGLSWLVWLFGRGHHAVVLENLALRQQLIIYKRTKKRPQLVKRDRWFWIALSSVWKNWRRSLFVVHPDTVVRWQRERFRRYWAQRSKKSIRRGRPPISRQVREFRHLRKLLKSYFAYYHRSRTHLALAKDAPESRAIMSRGEIVVIPQVGGLHRRYERHAA